MYDVNYVQERAITRIHLCVELIDILSTWRKTFIMIIIMLCYFEIFTSCQGSMETFPKHYSKCKAVSIRFRKTLQERRLPILKLSQDNPQKSFLNFLTSRTILITLQYFGHILGIFLKWTFVDIARIFWKIYFSIIGICQKINICYYQIIHF